MSNKSDTGSKGNRVSGITFVYLAAEFALVFLIAPVCADETSYATYLSGKPQLSVHLSGTNEFVPGNDYNVPIAVDNSGTAQFRIVKSSMINPGDDPSTAKNLLVTLGSADAPVVVKSDPQLAGNLPGSSSTTATFHLTINDDAPAGIYSVPVTLNYTYLYQANQYGTDTLSYTYKSVNQTVLIPVKIKATVQITALSESTKDLNAANEGFVFVSLKNTGFENGRDAVVSVQAPQSSPLSPTEGSFYIGDYPVGSVANCTFKLQVSSDAQQKTYPLNVKVNYKNSDGVYVDSRTITIGVPVGSKITFAVEPVKTDITPGSTALITVNFRNTGSATSYNTQARISAVDPFSSNDDTAFLGTMAPGEVRPASYKISVRSDTTTKDFGLDSEVLYRDALDNDVTSDPLKVTVHVAPPAGNFLSNGIIGPVIIVGILIGLGYWIYSRRIKNR
jgi:hypothetical protein